MTQEANITRHANGEISSLSFYNEKGQEDGTWMEYFENGKRSRVTEWKDGQRVTDFTYWGNGKVRRHSVWWNDGTQCFTEEWSEDGELLHTISEEWKGDRRVRFEEWCKEGYTPEEFYHYDFVKSPIA